MTEINLVLTLVCFFRSNPVIPTIAFRWFSFRLMLSAGLVKWYGSEMWRKLTAMSVHYFTQPLPNPLTFYAHHQPEILHKIGVAASLVIELVFPFLIFSPWPTRYFAYFSFFVLMVMINTTGNYGYLGLTTVILCLPILDDSVLPEFFLNFWKSVDFDTLSLLPFPFHHWFVRIVFEVLGLVVIFSYVSVSLVPLFQCTKGTLYSYLPPVLDRYFYSLQQFCFMNRYGMFAAMHDYRWEFQIEGSEDGKEWKVYEFKYKVNNEKSMPPVIPLYWPRLDWMIWFLPLTYKRNQKMVQLPMWYWMLLKGILENSPEIVDLLKTNPFPDSPPKFVRTAVYDFKIAPLSNTEGKWWSKSQSPVGFYGPDCVTLDVFSNLQ